MGQHTLGFMYRPVFFLAAVPAVPNLLASPTFLKFVAVLEGPEERSVLLGAALGASNVWHKLDPSLRRVFDHDGVVHELRLAKGKLAFLRPIEDGVPGPLGTFRVPGCERVGLDLSWSGHSEKDP